MPVPRRTPLATIRRRSPIRRALGVAVACLTLAGAAAGCAGRTVEVSAGAVEGTDATLVVTNPLAQPLNLYVRPDDGEEIFLRQLPAEVTETIPVRGLGLGTRVRLRAAPVDGATSYVREGVVLSRGVTWRVGG